MSTPPVYLQGLESGHQKETEINSHYLLYSAVVDATKCSVKCILIMQ